MKYSVLRNQAEVHTNEYYEIALLVNKKMKKEHNNLVNIRVQQNIINDEFLNLKNIWHTYYIFTKLVCYTYLLALNLGANFFFQNFLISDVDKEDICSFNPNLLVSLYI